MIQEIPAITLKPSSVSDKYIKADLTNWLKYSTKTWTNILGRFDKETLNSVIPEISQFMFSNLLEQKCLEVLETAD